MSVFVLMTVEKHNDTWCGVPSQSFYSFEEAYAYLREHTNIITAEKLPVFGTGWLYKTETKGTSPIEIYTAIVEIPLR